MIRFTRYCLANMRRSFHGDNFKYRRSKALLRLDLCRSYFEKLNLLLVGLKYEIGWTIIRKSTFQKPSSNFLLPVSIRQQLSFIRDLPIKCIFQKIIGFHYRDIAQLTTACESYICIRIPWFNGWQNIDNSYKNYFWDMRLFYWIADHLKENFDMNLHACTMLVCVNQITACVKVKITNIISY